MSASRPSGDAVERHEQLERASAARAHRHRATGGLLISVAVAIFLGPFLVLVVLWLGGVKLGEWTNTVGAVLVPVSLALIVQGRRMRVRGAELVLASDARAPIVYLRPFGADRAEIVGRWSSRVRISMRAAFEKTYEERLARTLREVGPFVAIGNPTERLPLLGAARMYAADEDWQESVDDLTDRASVILLHAGEGDGFGWEVHHVITDETPERTILSLPLHARRREASRQERYDGFRRRFGDGFPRPLPELIGHCQFVYFEPDWTPRLLGERGARLPAGDSERARALRCLAQEFKIAWGPLWARYIVYCAAFLAALAGIEGLIGSLS